MAQVRDTTINNSVGNIVKQGGGLPKSSASSLSIDKNKKRAFYRHYASGMLDEDRITDEGWKSIYEYQLENGLRTLDELDQSVLKKYNVDTSLATKKTPVAPELDYATEETVGVENKEVSFISKLLGSLKPNNTTVTDRERNDKLRPITSEYGEASRKSISDLQEKINAPYNGVDMNSLIKDKDPLMMALNSKLGNASTSEQLGSLLDQYRNKTNISQNDGPSYLKGEVGKKDNIDANNNGGYMPKSPMVNPLAAHTTQQSFKYDGKIEPALHFKLGALNADIGREMTKRMYGQPNRVDDLVREYETLIQANPHLVESRLNQDTNFWNFVAAGIEGTAQQLGMQSTYWGEAGGAAATGAVLGGATALALGNLGPQALTGVDDAILLPTMMKKGAQLFAGAESFKNMFQIEAGLSYKDMIEQGIDADTAKTWATVVGLINAGIEVNQIGDVIKTLPGAKDIIKGITKKGLEEATEKFVKRGYKDLAKDYVKFIFGETGQEVVQEIVPIVATEKAKGKTLGKSIAALAEPENTKRLFDTATQSIATFVFMGLPGVGGNIISVKSNNKNVQSVFDHMDKVEQSVDGLTFKDFQGMDDDTKKTIFAYKGTLDTALKNKLFDEEATAKAQALSDKIDSFIVNKSVGKEEVDIIAQKGHDTIYPTFKANLDGIDEARKLVETLDDTDAAEVKETLDSFMADKRVTKLLEFFNGIDTKEPDGSINAKMAEFNEIYDEYFNPTDEVTVEEEMVQKPTMDKPVQSPSDVNNINQDQQVEDDTITPPQGNTSPETVSPDLEGYSDVEKQAVGNFMAETDKLYARIGGTPDQANAMRLATTMVDAIRNKDFKELQERLNGDDDTLSKRMFTEITGLPATNQDEAFESIRSLDPDAYDEYINSTEIKTPTKEEAEVKQDDKAIEREKKNKERYDSYAVKKIEYNGKVISMQEYADAIFAEGFRITNENEYGGFELSKGNEKILVNKWDKDKRWFIKKAFDKYLEKELAAEEKEEADRRAAMTQEERDAEDAAIDHLFGKDKKPKETPADESISDFDKEVEDAVVEEVDNEIKDDEAEKQVEEVEQHTPTKEVETDIKSTGGTTQTEPTQKVKTLADYGMSIEDVETSKGNKVLNVSGETKPYKDILKGLGGNWYGKLSVWGYRKTKYPTVESLENAILAKIAELEGVDNVEDTTTTTVVDTPETGYTVDEMIGIVRDRLKDEAPDGWKNGHVIKERVVRSKIGDILEENGVPQEQQTEMAVEIFERLKKEKDITDLITEIANESAKDTKSGNVKADNIMFNDFAKEITENFREYVDNFKLNKLIEENDKNHHIGEINDLPNNSELQSKVLRLFTDLYGDDNALDLSEMLEEAVAKKIRKMQNSKQSPESPVTGTETSTANAKKRVNIFFDDLMEEMKDELSDLGLADEYEMDQIIELNGNIGIGAINDLATNYQQEIGIKNLLNRVFDGDVADRIYDLILSRVQQDNKNSTPDKSTQSEAKEPPKVNHEPSQYVADRVKEHLMNGEKFTYVNLFNYADKGYNGTQANHDYEVKDAYDGLELGVNQYLLEQDTIPIFYGVDQTDRKPEVAIEVLDQLTEMLDLVPTQSSKRTVEMEQYQQFSTPPNIAYVANWVADINPDDVMLEPSAGIGGLAVFAKAKGATVIVNELSPRRLEILKNMPFDGFYNENAEHIDNILPDDVRPTVVVMNPPFSATAGRTASNSTANAKMHLEQALERLEEGGRLVAIVGHTMGEDFPTFANWWKDIKSKYNVKANITIDGSNYKKYGTTYSVNLVVIDKNGPTANETLTGQYVNLADVIRALEGIKNDRYEARTRQIQQDADKPVRQGSNAETGAGGRIRGASSTGTNANSGGRSGATNTGRAPISNNATDTDTIQTSDEATDPRRGAVDNTRNDEVSQRPDGRSDVSSGKSDVNSGNTGRSNEITLEQNTDKRVVDTENIDKIFSDYTPSKVKIKGAKPHKGKLSESTAMGAVLPPDPTYTPMIPEKIVNNGDLSDAQLEAIVYAGQSHEQLLPDESRRGFFIGDGTGVGKGREIAGIILDNYNHGRKKSVWVSVNQKLFPDAQRDIESMGMNKDHIFKLPKVGARITQEDGTLFVPYGTFKMNQEKSGLHQQEYSPNQPYKLDLSIRIEQMIDWLGHDFDGVIVFDESHKMANAVGMKGSRGKTKPSQTALAGLLLQSKLPKARVVYVSATGASEITNLAYLSRLGLWGDGTPFANVSEFINAISSGGLSAMELIARDMKAMGAYVARSLSYDDVTYERVEHQLNEHQYEAYGIMAHAWQIVMQNMEKALEDTNAPGQKAGNARGAFWGSQQRFFNQILLSDSMPTTLDHIEKDIKAGNTVVIQLTSTNEALMNRQVAKAQEEDMDYEDLDMSPRDILIEYLRKSFPVEQYEDYVDEYGNVRKRPVVDSNGKPVLNKAALRARDELIQKVAAINMPDAPIDMIINRFGTKNVAEITGRSKRLERTISSNGSEKVDLVNRTDAIRDKELDDFINDKRRILIFSQAGGTGKSYHASNDYKNNHKRVHYMLESGFNVMNAMQGLGRTHRTNQKSAPHVKLITTSVPGHKRFISTIARRFDQLGALTRGQREAASQGLFSEKDNLEGPTARDALRSFYELLARDKLEAHGLYSEEVLSKMGLTKYLLDQWGQLRSDAPELTDVRKFLNRLLVLDIDLQDKVFDVYSQILEQSVEQAIERGTLDVGLENFKAASVKLAEEITIRKDPRTGAETKIVTFDVKEDVPTISFDELDLEISNFKGFYKNTRSGIVRAYYVSKSVTDDSGRVESSYRAYEPEKGKVQRVRESELNKDTMEKVSLEEARELWDKQLKEVPKYKESQKNLITGVLLPIWDKVTNTDEKTRVMRIITDDGSEHLGLLIKEDRVDVIIGRLNFKGTQKTYAAEDVYSGVFNDNKVAGLSNGWRIKRSRVAGDNRIELIGPDYSHLTYLRRIGVFPEVISNKTRYFIPTNKSQAIKIIEDIISTRTVTRLYSNSDEQKASFASTAGPMPKNVLSNEARKKTEPKGISDIIKDIERDFSIVITSKRYRNSRGASGFYRVHSEAIHVKVDNNINVISHELGHHLDKKYGLSDRYYAYIADMRDKLELSSAYKYKEEEIPGEVIAEFIRLYLTTDDKAKELSEDFYNAFMETIDKDDLKKLNKHKKDITDWFKSTMRDRVKSTQKSRTEKKEKVWSEEALKAEMYFFDDLAPIRALTETVEEMTGQKIKISDNPYVLALNTRRAGMIAKNIVLSGLTDAEGNIIGKSMKEVLSKIDREHMDDFDAYLKAKHAITLNDYDIRVFSDEFSMDEIIELVNEYEEEFPQFVETAEELYQWWSTFIEEWVVKPGFMDDRTWEELQAKYPTYVPNSRVLDDTTRGMWAKRGFGNQHSPIKRIKGSAKDTYAVIESMMLYADKIVKVQKRNEVGQAIHKLYNTVEGLGDYLEKVAPETARNKYDARALKIHLMDSLAEEFEKGLSDADKAKVGVIRATGDYQKYIDFLKSKGFTADVIVDNTIDDIITYFTPKSFSTDETVFTVVDESGKSHFYYSKDPLFLEAMLNIDGRKMDDFVRLLGGMKRVFTTLTTGANPMFALFSNIWADVPEAMVYGDYKNPFEFGKALAKAMIDTGVHLQKQYRHKNTFDDTSKWGKEAKAYKAMGGGFSSQISDQRNLMAEMLNSVFPDRKKSSVKAMADYAIELIEQFNDTIETAPRLAIYNKAIAEYGDTYEGRLLAMYKASEATTNFLRRGKLHYTAIGQGTPFLNAGLQGLYKLNRELVRMKGVDKNDINEDGKRVKDTKALRSVLTKALLYVTLFEISQMVAYDDDEDYDKLPEYTKDGYYLFKLGDGKFFKIRKPRVLSVLFGSTFRRGFKSAFEGDEEAWKGFGEAFVNTVLPPNPVTDNIFSPLIQAYANKSWTGAPIVSKGMEYRKTSDQYDSNTTELSKFVARGLSDKFGVEISPKKMDYVLQQYTGVIGQFAIPMMSKNKTVGGMLQQKMVADVAFSNDSISRFYDTKTSLDQAYSSYTSSGRVTKDFDPVKRYRYGQVADELSSLYDQIDAIKDNIGLTPAEKQSQEREIRKQMIEITSEENLKPTAYDEFKVLYNRGQDITSKYKKQYEETGIKPNYTEDEAVLLNMYNIKVQDGRSELGYVNYQIGQIDKRIKEIEGKNTIPEAQKKTAIKKLEDTKTKLTDDYMAYYKKNYGIDIVDFFK